ncbi:MAG: hypothetical protein ACAI44_27010, partial [Candidatus Sericytochromatia bacterium]
ALTPRVSMDPNGDFAITWSSETNSDQYISDPNFVLDGGGLVNFSINFGFNGVKNFSFDPDTATLQDIVDAINSSDNGDTTATGNTPRIEASFVTDSNGAQNNKVTIFNRVPGNTDDRQITFGGANAANMKAFFKVADVPDGNGVGSTTSSTAAIGLLEITSADYATGSGKTISELIAAARDDRDIYARNYKGNGAPWDDQFIVNTGFGTGDQFQPDVSKSFDGSTAIVWNNLEDDDANPAGIYAKFFDRNRNVLAADFKVSDDDSPQELPSVFMSLPQGNTDIKVGIAWSDADVDNAEVRARVFDGDGVPAGPEFQVNTTTEGNQTRPAITVDENGAFAVVWQSDIEDGESGNFGIYGQRYNVDNSRNGSEFNINLYSPGNQDNPDVILDNDGHLVTVWDSMGDGVTVGVYAQRYDANGEPEYQE